MTNPCWLIVINTQIQVSWPSIIQEVWWDHGLQTLYGPDLGGVFFDHCLMMWCSFFATFFFLEKSPRSNWWFMAWCHEPCFLNFCWGLNITPDVFFLHLEYTYCRTFDWGKMDKSFIRLNLEVQDGIPNAGWWFRSPAPVERCKCILYTWNPYKNWDLCYINLCRMSEPSTGATVDLGRLDASDFDKDWWLQVVAQAGRRLTTGPGQVDSPVPKLHKRSGAVF